MLAVSGVSAYETYVDGLMASTFFALNGLVGCGHMSGLVAAHMSAGPRMRALKSRSDFRSRVNSDVRDRGNSCQPRIRWDSQSRTMIPAFGRGSSKRRLQSD